MISAAERPARLLGEPGLRARGRVARPAALGRPGGRDRAAAGAGGAQPGRARPARGDSGLVRQPPTALERIAWRCAPPAGGVSTGRRSPRLQLACVGPAEARRTTARAGSTRSASTAMAGLRVDEVAAEPIQRGEDRARAAEADRLRARLLPRARGSRSTRRAPPRPRARRSRAGSRERMDDRPVAFVVGGALGIDAGAARRVRRAPVARAADDAPPARPGRAGRAALPRPLHHRGHPYPH